MKHAKKYLTLDTAYRERVATPFHFGLVQLLMSQRSVNSNVYILFPCRAVTYHEVANGKGHAHNTAYISNSSVNGI